jgi:NADH-quinone oxidoreductase subunit N
VQTDLKRMLAYSSIAHAGYLLIGLAAAPTNPEGISASMFYLLAYAFMVMGAFMVVQYAARQRQLSAVRVGAGRGAPAGADSAASEPPDDADGASLDDFRGFGRRHPWPAALLALFMFALAGIPPLSGFWAKYYVFQAGINAGLAWLVVIGVISSVISAFFYLRVIMVTYLQEPAERAGAVGLEGPRTGELAEPERRQRPVELALGVALGVAAVLTVAIGLAPQVLVTAAQTAGRILG